VSGDGTPSATEYPDPAVMARHLVSALRQAGTDVMFGVPGGGSNLDVIGAAEAAGCRFVLTHGETAAAIMAGTTAELTGRPGACVVTRGPGVASAVNGVAQAHLDRQPMVLVADCVITTERDRVSHQRIDHTALLAPVTKASTRFGPHDRTMPADAVALARSGRPGVVHLDLDPTAPPQPLMAQSSTEPWGDVDAVRAILRSSRRPVVIVGVGAVAMPLARRAAVQDALTRWLEKSNAPVLTSYKARGAVSDFGPHAAGVVSGATIESALLREADLIVGVGVDPIELIPSPWPYAAPIVLLGAWSIDDSTFFGDRVAAEVVGDLEITLGTLNGELHSTWPEGEAKARREAMRQQLLDARSTSGPGLAPHDVVTTARARAPRGTIATVDAGAHMLVAVPLWDVEHAGELLVSSGLATMGFALPAAIAAAIVRPERTVVCFTGDGGLGMVLAELETLARLHLKVIVVVFNDSLLSLIAVKQRAEGQGGGEAVRYRATDFATMARAHGIPAERVSEIDDYRRALEEAFAREGPTVIDVVVDPSCYGMVLDAIRGGTR
jgi:acetolactate synthase I/II/III large subunit